MLDEVIDKVDVVRVVYQDEYIHVGSFFVAVRAMRMVYNSTHSMFWRPGSLSAILRLFRGL